MRDKTNPYQPGKVLKPKIRWPGGYIRYSGSGHQWLKVFVYPDALIRVLVKLVSLCQDQLDVELRSLHTTVEEIQNCFTFLADHKRYLYRQFYDEDIALQLKDKILREKCG